MKARAGGTLVLSPGLLGEDHASGVAGAAPGFWSKSLDLGERWPVLSVSEPWGSSVAM